MDRILFITSTRIGDAVLSSGLLAHLAAKHPDARITVACGPLAAPLFRAAPGVERVIEMAKRRFSLHWLDLWRQVAGTRWDLVVDMRASAIAMLVRTKERRVKRTNGEIIRHKVAEAAAVLGLESPPDPVVWLDDAARAKAAARMPEGRVLAVAPAAAAPFKEWPRDRFAALAAALTGKGGALEGGHVVIFGGPGDEAAAREAAEGLDPERVTDLTGQLDILEAAACLERATVFVGNDSGLMHLAAAAGTPALGLFGPTDERLYGPWGPKARAIRAGGPANERDRAKLRFATESLMGDLQLDPVLDAARTLIEEHGR
jgi:heptosyltransferase-3